MYLVLQTSSITLESDFHLEVHLNYLHNLINLNYNRRATCQMGHEWISRKAEKRARTLRTVVANATPDGVVTEVLKFYRSHIWPGVCREPMHGGYWAAVRTE